MLVGRATPSRGAVFREITFVPRDHVWSGLDWADARTEKGCVRGSDTGARRAEGPESTPDQASRWNIAPNNRY